MRSVQPAELPPPLPTARNGQRAVFQTLDQGVRYPYSAREYSLRVLWLLVERTVFRFSGSRASRLRVCLLRLFSAKVAPTALIRPTVRIRHPWLLEIGEHASVGDHVNIYNLGPLAIGEHTSISQRVHLCGGTHEHRDPRLPLVRSGVRIGRGCWVCAEAFIGPGVTVGDNTIVGARAVVASSVGPDVIVAGNPARVIGPRPMP